MHKQGNTMHDQEKQMFPLFSGDLSLYFSARISTYPSVPCTRIRCPSLISLVAFSTPTTGGKPYSPAIAAPRVISPPTSATRPLMETNNGVQLGSVNQVTRISPSSRTA